MTYVNPDVKTPEQIAKMSKQEILNRLTELSCSDFYDIPVDEDERGNLRVALAAAFEKEKEA